MAEARLLERLTTLDLFLLLRRGRSAWRAMSALVE